MITLSDPFCQSTFPWPKSEVIAFSAADDAAAEVLSLNHIRHQLIVDIRQKQIRSREGAEFLPQLSITWSIVPGASNWV